MGEPLRHKRSQQVTRQGLLLIAVGGIVLEHVFTIGKRCTTIQPILLGLACVNKFKFESLHQKFAAAAAYCTRKLNVEWHLTLKANSPVRIN